MSSDSESESSLEGEVEVRKESSSHWGKSKHDYYYTDYIDKDYPSKLSSKEEQSARIEQEEALRIQKKLLSTLDNLNIQPTFDIDSPLTSADSKGSESIDQEFDLIDFLEKQNKSIDSQFNSKGKSKKRKRVAFEDDDPDSDDGESSPENEQDDDDNEDDEDDDDGEADDHEVAHQSGKSKKKIQIQEEAANDRRRPINIAMKKNRGLTPYKKKEYRNPRVKHKNKYRKAMIKRKRNVREAQTEYHRYSGETHGIKTSTIKSIKLC